MSLRDALAFLCEREIARKDQRRIDMSFGLAKFPFAGKTVHWTVF